MSESGGSFEFYFQQKYIGLLCGRANYVGLLEKGFRPSEFGIQFSGDADFEDFEEGDPI